eukprot:5449909-Amphidinium_carterae.2
MESRMCGDTRNQSNFLPCRGEFVFPSDTVAPGCAPGCSLTPGRGIKDVAIELMTASRSSATQI